MMTEGKNQMLTAERVRSLLMYSPELGSLVWMVDKGIANKGAAAGYFVKSGYRIVGIDGVKYGVHRVVWLLHYGTWPKHEIDHIDGNRGNNRIENLRDVPRMTNAQNMHKPNTRNKAGLLGVSTEYGKSRACICVNGKTVHLGTFATADDAHAAYIKAKRALHAGCAI